MRVSRSPPRAALAHQGSLPSSIPGIRRRAACVVEGGAATATRISVRRVVCVRGAFPVACQHARIASCNATPPPGPTPGCPTLRRALPLPRHPLAPASTGPRVQSHNPPHDAGGWRLWPDPRLIVVDSATFARPADFLLRNERPRPTRHCYDHEGGALWPQPPAQFCSAPAAAWTLQGHLAR